MATLYELTGQYKQLLDLMEDPDIPEETVRDTLEGIGGEIEEKADAYAKIMRQLQAEADAIEKEEERLNDRRDMLMSRIVSMKSALIEAMRATGKPKFKTTLFSFGIRKASQKPVVMTPDRSLEMISFFIFSFNFMLPPSGRFLPNEFQLSGRLRM